MSYQVKFILNSRTEKFVLQYLPAFLIICAQLRQSVLLEVNCCSTHTLAHTFLVLINLVTIPGSFPFSVLLWCEYYTSIYLPGHSNLQKLLCTVIVMISRWAHASTSCVHTCALYLNLCSWPCVLTATVQLVFFWIFLPWAPEAISLQ